MLLCPDLLSFFLNIITVAAMKHRDDSKVDVMFLRNASEEAATVMSAVPGFAVAATNVIDGGWQSIAEIQNPTITPDIWCCVAAILHILGHGGEPKTLHQYLSWRGHGWYLTAPAAPPHHRNCAAIGCDELPRRDLSHNVPAAKPTVVRQFCYKSCSRAALESIDFITDLTKLSFIYAAPSLILIDSYYYQTSSIQRRFKDNIK